MRLVDLRDKEAFADKLRKLAMDGSQRFKDFQYDVEADIEKFVDIAQQVSLTHKQVTHAYCKCPQSPKCSFAHASWYVEMQLLASQLICYRC